MVEQLLDDMRPVLRGLDTVRVKKEDLVKVITDNRAEHRKIFEEAIEGWHKQVQKRLQELVKKAKEGPDSVDLVIALPRPEDHTKDYDRVLKMLQLSQDDEMELSDHEFRQYVMDDWGWQQSFLTTSSSYSTTAARKLSR